MANEMVFVRINAEKDTVTSRQYGVAGFPTIILAKSDGSEIDRIYGYAEGAEFVKTIRDYMADRNTLGDYLRRADTAATPQTFYLIAEKYVGRKKFAEAEGYYQKILQADPENKKGYSDSAFYSLADMKSRDKKYAEAEQLYGQLRAKFSQSPLAEDALFGIAATKRRAEQYDDAIAGFRKFLETYPESKQKEDAEIYIALCYEKKGDTTEAVRLYQKFLTDHPQASDGPWVKNQITKITSPPEKKEGK